MMEPGSADRLLLGEEGTQLPEKTVGGSIVWHPAA
jgi:hypothetical protein